MKIAIFSDIHGNLENLESFYESAKELEVDEFLCLGDICDYYPDNKKVIDFLRKNKISSLLGNHDELYISNVSLDPEKKSAYSFDEDLLRSKEHIDFLKTLPLKKELKLNGKAILFCHAAPDNLLNKYIYPDTDLSPYYQISYDFVFMGHSHRQFLRREAAKTFCNVGSIGMPRDNGSLMSFAVLDTRNMGVILYRKPVNVKKIMSLYAEHVSSDVMNLLNRKEPLNYSYIIIK